MVDMRAAQELLVLVNKPDFQELVDIFVEEKKKEQYRILEQSDDKKDIFRAQGACQVLNKMKAMKTEIQAAAKRD